VGSGSWYGSPDKLPINNANLIEQHSCRPAIADVYVVTEEDQEMFLFRQLGFAA